jgi:hypothetical protein
MAHYTIKLNYGADGAFRPDKVVWPVNKNDTISFQLGTAPPNSTFKITATDPEFFSPAEITGSSTIVTVVEAIKFRCQLFDALGSLLSRGDQDGLHVIP